jgi:hypothetical protein
MKSLNYDIEIISAPSILGLKPTGVEKLGESLLASGLAENLGSTHRLLIFLRLTNFTMIKKTRKQIVLMQNLSGIFL